MFLTVEGSITAGFVNRYWQSMFENDGLFLNISAKNLFFEGYDFCITANMDAITNSMCDQVRNLIVDSKTTVSDSEKIRFSFFSHVSISTYIIYNAISKKPYSYILMYVVGMHFAALEIFVAHFLVFNVFRLLTYYIQNTSGFTVQFLFIAEK